MRISTKGEYACLALIELAEKYEKGVVRIEDISKKKKIPQKYLEQILLILKGTGYVRSKRGPLGGYELAKAPENISVAEIIRLMDGALAPIESVSTYFYEKTPLEQNKKLISVLKNIRDYISDTLEQTSFKDLV